MEITGEGDPHPGLVDEPQPALALGASVQNVPPQQPQTAQQQGSGIDYGPVLIKNRGQALSQDNAGIVSAGDAGAQKFTTGPNLTGYLLDRVAVAVNREKLDDLVYDDRSILRMTVREDCSGDPCGAVFATLSNPVGFIIHGNLQDAVSRGLLVFGSVGSHRDIQLERNTDYWLRLDYPGTLRVKITDSTASDPGGASGWSMGQSNYFNWPDWTVDNTRVQMSLHGRTPNLDLTTWDYHPVAGHGLWGTTGGSDDRLWVSSGANRKDVFSYSLEDEAYGDPVIDTDWKLFNDTTPGGGTVKALSNMDVATHSSNYGLVFGGNPGAQSFTTGDDYDRYRLKSVVVITGQTSIPSGLTATIRKPDSNGHPGDVVLTLTNPSSFSNNGRAVFFAPPDSGRSCRGAPSDREDCLDLNKTYFFHLEAGACSDSQYVTPATCEAQSETWNSSGALNLKRTQANRFAVVDGDGEPGWGLDLAQYYDTDDGWQEVTDAGDNFAIKIEVNIINYKYFGRVHNSNYGQQCVHDKARITDSKRTVSDEWTGHGPDPGEQAGDTFNDIVHGHLVGKGIVFCDVASRPVGLWSDGTTMWVGDQATGMVRGFNLNTKERDSGKDFDARIGGIVTPRITGITGITGHGSKMWVAHAVSGKLLAYVKPSSGATDGDRSSSDDITLTAANAVPSSLYTDGTTMWVLDDGDQKLYAYTLSNGNRNSGKDLDLTRHGRLFASGIWSDGSKMYVGGNHWVTEQQNLWPRYVHYGPFSAKACQRIADRLESIGSNNTLDTDSDYSNGCVEIDKDSDGEAVGTSFYGVTGETTNNHGEGTGGCQKTYIFDNRVYSSDGSAWVNEAYPRVGCTGYARVLAYPKP